MCYTESQMSVSRPWQWLWAEFKWLWMQEEIFGRLYLFIFMSCQSSRACISSLEHVSFLDYLICKTMMIICLVIIDVLNYKYTWYIAYRTLECKDSLIHIATRALTGQLIHIQSKDGVQGTSPWQQHKKKLVLSLCRIFWSTCSHLSSCNSMLGLALK